MCILSIECLCDSCSILSKYGVHGFPTLFILNSTMRVRYHGSRTLASLVGFYNDVTGEAHCSLITPYPCIGISVLCSNVHATFNCDSHMLTRSIHNGVLIKFDHSD